MSTGSQDEPKFYSAAWRGSNGGTFKIELSDLKAIQLVMIDCRLTYLQTNSKFVVFK